MALSKLRRRSNSTKSENSGDASRTSTRSDGRSFINSKMRSPMVRHLDLMISRKMQKQKVNQAIMHKIALHSLGSSSSEFSIINHDSHTNSRDCSPYEIENYLKSQCKEGRDSKNISYRISAYLMAAVLLIQLPWLIQFVAIAVLIKFVLYVTEWVAWIFSMNEVATLNNKGKKSMFGMIHSYFVIYSWLTVVQIAFMFLKRNFFHKEYIRNMRSAARYSFIQETEGMIDHKERKIVSKRNRKSWSVSNLSGRGGSFSKRKSQINSIVSVDKQIIAAKTA